MALSVKTLFNVEVTVDQQVEATITQWPKGGDPPLEIVCTMDAIDALQMAKLLEAAAVAVQAQSTGAKPS